MGAMLLLLAALVAAAPAAPIDGECPEEPPAPLASPQAEPPKGQEQWERSLFLLVTPEAHTPLTLEASLGGQLVRGNRDILRLEVDLTLVVPITSHLLALTRVRGAFEDALNVTVAQRGEALQRVDFFFAERTSLFAGAAWVHDPFLGIRTRAVGLLGVGHEVLLERHPEHPHIFLRAGHLEVGGFVAREYTMRPLAAEPDVIVRDGINDMVGPRVAGYYYRTLDQRSAVGLESQLVLDLLELPDLVVISTGFIEVAVWGPLSARVFLTHRFDGRPAPGVRSKHDFFSALAFSLSLEGTARPDAGPPDAT
ncbi:MAG: DUF481 domain-containing protein [Myxococcaceae bacterium]